jgi:hypothetical protein
MKTLLDLSVDIRVGQELGSIQTKPLVPYSAPVLDFLGDLSKSLLGSPACREFPDIAAFGYWCRPANLAKMAREADNRFSRLGRGLALHIAPANVPVNFAFSLAFGMLAGNANIVRMPERGFPQSEFLCAQMHQLFREPQHALVSTMNRVVRYPRDDEITTALSKICQARILWGGDSTISNLRSMPSPPRCVDVCFADRYSLCALGAQALLDCSDEKLNDLARGFYNDAYLMDQNACSSPHLVLWVGDETNCKLAATKFWDALSVHVRKNYNLQPVQAVDKFVDLCRTAIEFPRIGSFLSSGNYVYRLELNELPKDIENWRGRNGFFYEYSSSDLLCLPQIVGERFQTLTHFGMDPVEIANLICDAGLKGIDRIVPVGKALDIGVYWDGFDVVSCLSRIVFKQSS